MKYKLYCVKDELVGFGIPTAEQNEQTALRNFSYAANQKGTLIYENSKDYSLYYVGEFNTDTGVFAGLPIPEKLVDANSVIDKKDENV